MRKCRAFPSGYAKNHAERYWIKREIFFLILLPSVYFF
ncbi:Uncharacterized protein dnm_066140 [Desulfonema magnum]|uniref:Uncharacterized protein n=1 Tax=Desulfonema magnum TaxID=45655 RepID=A0A975GR39_9BACT|nr:Uncharacterized protein dnm_066140 [Desulfonema magnum]